MQSLRAIETATPAIHPTTVGSDAWESLAGMAALKDQIERRVLLPVRERPPVAPWPGPVPAQAPPTAVAPAPALAFAAARGLGRDAGPALR
jgi:hypothetical protein